MNIKICDTLWKQATGLMFRWPKKPFAYIFIFPKERFELITMWWVFYSIDVLVLDTHHVIKEIKTIRPFSHTSIRAKVFIELPAGYAKEHKLKIGMSASWGKDALKFR